MTFSLAPDSHKGLQITTVFEFGGKFFYTPDRGSKYAEMVFDISQDVFQNPRVQPVLPFSVKRRGVLEAEGVRGEGEYDVLLLEENKLQYMSAQRLGVGFPAVGVPMEERFVSEPDTVDRYAVTLMTKLEECFNIRAVERVGKVYTYTYGPEETTEVMPYLTGFLKERWPEAPAGGSFQVLWKRDAYNVFIGMQHLDVTIGGAEHSAVQLRLDINNRVRRSLQRNDWQTILKYASDFHRDKLFPWLAHGEGEA